jgi:hypothetical protein
LINYRIASNLRSHIIEDKRNFNKWIFGQKFCKLYIFTVRKMLLSFSKATCSSRNRAFSILWKSEKIILEFVKDPNFQFEKNVKKVASEIRSNTVLKLFVCLFSWRYNPLWLYFHSPVAGFSLLVFEVS